MVDVKIVKTEIGKNFENAVKTLHDKVAKVGWLKSIYYIESKTPVAQVAAIQEKGYPAKNIPARPFMRPTIKREENNWKRMSQALAKRVLAGEMPIEDLMELLGQKAAGDVKKTISQIFSPALAESTIMARISKNSRLNRITKRQLTTREIGNITKPLIDTGLMFATLTNSVEDA